MKKVRKLKLRKEAKIALIVIVVILSFLSGKAAAKADELGGNAVLSYYRDKCEVVGISCDKYRMAQERDEEMKSVLREAYQAMQEDFELVEEIKAVLGK